MCGRARRAPALPRARDSKRPPAAPAADARGAPVSRNGRESRARLRGRARARACSDAGARRALRALPAETGLVAREERRRVRDKASARGRSAPGAVQRGARTPSDESHSRNLDRGEMRPLARLTRGGGGAGGWRRALQGSFGPRKPPRARPRAHAAQAGPTPSAPTPPPAQVRAPPTPHSPNCGACGRACVVRPRERAGRGSSHSVRRCVRRVGCAARGWGRHSLRWCAPAATPAESMASLPSYNAAQQTRRGHVDSYCYGPGADRHYWRDF